MTLVPSIPRFALLPILALLAMVGGAVYAQLEGGERGVPPIDSTGTLEVTGVEVDVTAKSSEEARYEGWRQAQLKGWKALWAKTNGRPQSEAANLPDGVLNGIVSGIIIEQEQIGPRRYIARLGVLFDRVRAGQLLGLGGPVRRSQPMLVIPVMLTGSSFQSFESRNEWQKAWARFRTGGSAIDYVRTSGSGVDPLLLNASQTGRPGRGWWRRLLDQYGAADIVVPGVHLKRLYPGGPALGIFTARHGPDNELIDRFVLRVENSGAIPRMMDEGVRRIDAAYTRALELGMLRSDPSLVEPPPMIEEVIEELPIEMPVDTGPIRMGAATTYSLQVDTPNAASVGQAELSVSRIGGVTSALTTSLALGGTSVMRVTYAGDIAALEAALRGQGWSVQNLGNALRITRGAPPGQSE